MRGLFLQKLSLLVDLNFITKRISMLPLLLTGLRFLLIPFIVWAISTYQVVWAAGLFLVAAITDWLDGLTARLLQQETVLGAYLDPLADKCLFMATLGALAYSSYTVSIPRWFFGLVMIRELSLIVGVAVMRFYNPLFVVHPLRSAKLATLWLSILVAYVLLAPLVGWYVEALYSLLFAITLYFMTVSWMLYGYEGYMQWLERA